MISTPSKALVLTMLAACLLPTASLAAEMRCSFDKYTASDGRNGPVDWQVVMTNQGKRAQVDVIGSGDYSGTFESASQGGWRYTFKTPSSLEVIAVSTAGKADWQIDFNAGGWLNYSGRCKTES